MITQQGNDNKFKKGDYVRYIGTSYPSAKNQIFKIKEYKQYKTVPSYIFLYGWYSGARIDPNDVELVEGNLVEQIDSEYRNAVESAINTALTSPKQEAVKAYAIYIDGKRVKTPKSTYRSKGTALNQLCEYLAKYIYQISPDKRNHPAETKLIISKMREEGRVKFVEVLEYTAE